MTPRQLRTTAIARREELADVLQTLFVVELLDPSDPLWIVSPWVSDVEVLDNRVDQLRGLVPDLPPRWIRLGEILHRVLLVGGSVVIATRGDAHNRLFTDQVQSRAAAAGQAERVVIHLAPELHEKGILTKRIHLSGSMNLTFNGLRRLEESIQVSADRESLARVRHNYEDRWSR
jgi:hypothetical protein